MDSSSTDSGRNIRRGFHGEMLSVRYMVTGMVIEMKSSVIIFTRIIDIETAQILGASQIIVEKDEDVKALL